MTIIRQQQFEKELDSTREDVTTQSPLPVSDGIVCKNDVWVGESQTNNFSGSVTDLFDNLHSVLTDSTSNNPKELLIHFESPVITSLIAIGAFAGASGQFSNLEIQGARSDGIFITLADESADPTIKQTEDYQLPLTVGFNAIKLLFHTTNTITISNLVIVKSRAVVSRLQAAQPAGTVADINATAGGNLKISLEELESGISVNSNSQLKITPYGSDGNEYKKDLITGSYTIVPYEHHEIHSGSHYNYCQYQLGNAVNDTIEFVVTTPNTTTWGHLTFQFYSSQGATVDVYEGTTGVTGGTSITPRNNNRNSLSTSAFTIVKDPTSITSDGTLASGFLAGAGRESGFATRDKENVLKQNEIYLLRITSLANSNDISWCFEWYEHANIT